MVAPLDNVEALRRGAQLFAETIAAHGGDAFLNLKTLKIIGKGQFTTPPQTGGLTIALSTCTFYIAMDGRSRLEARSPGGPLLFVLRGTYLGGFTVLAGRTLQIPAEQVNGIEPFSFLHTAAAKRYSVVAKESEAVEKADDGMSLLRYDILREDGKATRVFVESGTKLVRKMVTDTSRGEMAVLLSEYKLADGLPVFGEALLRENGADVLKLISAEVQKDVAINDALFEAGYVG